MDSGGENIRATLFHHPIVCLSPFSFTFPSQLLIPFLHNSHSWLYDSSMSCPKLSNRFHLSTSITFGVSIAWDLKNLYLLTMYLPSLMLIIILKIFSSTQESNLLCPKFFSPNKVLFTNTWYPFYPPWTVSSSRLWLCATFFYSVLSIDKL